MTSFTACIDDHILSSVPIGSAGGVVNTQHEEVIVIFHQYALLERGKSIHSAIQLEDWGTELDEKAIAFGGQQRVLTAEGYSIPMDISNGPPMTQIIEEDNRGRDYACVRS